MGAFFSGFSATMAWVVIINEATLEAFCKAKRTTLVGSMIPSLTVVFEVIGPVLTRIAPVRAGEVRLDL